MSNKLHAYLKKNADVAWDVFNEEISTDENKDYRRGFRAGILCAFLQIQSEALEIDHPENGVNV